MVMRLSRAKDNPEAEKQLLDEYIEKQWWATKNTTRRTQIGCEALRDHIVFAGPFMADREVALERLPSSTKLNALCFTGWCFIPWLLQDSLFLARTLACSRPRPPAATALPPPLPFPPFFFFCFFFAAPFFFVTIPVSLCAMIFAKSSTPIGVIVSLPSSVKIASISSSFPPNASPK